jgi:hypothetical protein
MLGRKERDQLELFIIASLSFRMSMWWHAWTACSTLSWLRKEVSDYYCLDDARPGIDPEVAVRLMLAGLLGGIVAVKGEITSSQVFLSLQDECARITSSFPR